MLKHSVITFTPEVVGAWATPRSTLDGWKYFLKSCLEAIVNIPYFPRAILLAAQIICKIDQTMGTATTLAATDQVKSRALLLSGKSNATHA